MEEGTTIECEDSYFKGIQPILWQCKIYDGQFKGIQLSGVGVTTALLRRHGIKVISEENLFDFLNEC